MVRIFCLGLISLCYGCCNKCYIEPSCADARLKIRVLSFTARNDGYIFELGGMESYLQRYGLDGLIGGLLDERTYEEPKMNETFAISELFAYYYYHRFKHKGQAAIDLSPENRKTSVTSALVDARKLSRKDFEKIMLSEELPTGK